MFSLWNWMPENFIWNFHCLYQVLTDGSQHLHFIKLFLVLLIISRLFPICIHIAFIRFIVTDDTSHLPSFHFSLSIQIYLSTIFNHITCSTTSFQYRLHIKKNREVVIWVRCFLDYCNGHCSFNQVQEV